MTSTAPIGTSPAVSASRACSSAASMNASRDMRRRYYSLNPTVRTVRAWYSRKYMFNLGAPLDSHGSLGAGAKDDESALHALGDFTANARLLLLSLVAIPIGIISAYVAVGLLALIAFFTNLFFFQRLSFAPASPAMHTLGWLVVVVPIAGGLIIGLMARY